MDIFENLSTRYSLRRYAERPVEREKLERCIEYAALSPSACNSQPWTFLAVDEPEVCAAVSEALRSDAFRINTFTRKVPAFVAVVNEYGNLAEKFGGALKDKNYSDFDIGIAVQSFCLCANELGLGTCIMGWFHERKLKQALGVPGKRRIALVIACGYPEEETKRPPKVRKALREVLRYNRYE